MTVQSETSKAVYIGDGVTNEFPVPFYFFDKQINVYLNFSDTPLREFSDYTIENPESHNGGMVTMRQTPANGDVISITRNVDLKQLITFLEGEDFPAKDYEIALDRLTMGLQQLRECIERAVLVPHGAEINGKDLFHCLEMLHRYWERILAVPDYIDQLMSCTTDTVAENDTRLVTSGGVAQYAYSKSAVDGKMDTLAQKFYNTAVSLSPNTVAANSDSEDYPYKFNIALEGVTAARCPVVMFGKEDALSENFAPYAEAYDGGITIYLKNDVTLETVIPLILLM